MRADIIVVVTETGDSDMVVCVVCVSTETEDNVNEEVNGPVHQDRLSLAATGARRANVPIMPRVLPPTVTIAVPAIPVPLPVISVISRDSGQSHNTGL